MPEITAIRVEIAPDAKTGWHWHNVPSFAVMLEGKLQVTLKNDKQKTLKAGDVLVEVVGTPNNGQNIGNTPAKLVVFYAGSVGMANIVKVPQ